MTSHWFEQDLRDQQSIDRLREPRTLRYLDNLRAELNGREITVFCSNDYLGLRSDPRIRAAGARALEQEAAGVGASRLVSGDVALFGDAENEFADWVGAEASLLFTSGFAANVGILPALAGEQDVLFSDSLNHASLVDGCRLSRARTVVYRHADPQALREAVSAARPFRRGWIITESVFSMDGDIAPLRLLRSLADQEHLGLYVDEAHGIGVFDESGRGVMHAEGVRADVLIGTLGKALGGAGAFAAGSRAMRLWLWNRARSFVFSTGPSIANAAMARAAIGIVRESHPTIRQLHRNSRRMRERLRDSGIGVGGVESCPIVPVVVGDDRRAVDVSLALLQQGFFVSAIRPPTVPPGTSRLRITLSAMHTDEQIDGLAKALARCL